MTQDTRPLTAEAWVVCAYDAYREAEAGRGHEGPHDQALCPGFHDGSHYELDDCSACGERHGLPTLIDLSRAAFSELADPGTGIVRVSIEWPQEAATLPPTDPTPHPDDERMRLEVRDDEVYR